MNKISVAACLLVVCSTITACSTNNQPAAAPPSTTNQSNSTNPTTNSTIANTTATGTNSSDLLAAYEPAATYGINVQTPTGWTSTPVQGGDFSGWKLTNPTDSNEQVIIVNSGCVGCTADSSGSDDAKLAIPEQGAHIASTTNNGHVVNYSFTKPGNPYNGTGTVIVSHNKSGYAYVETLLPAAEQAMASQIVGSFQLSR